MRNTKNNIFLFCFFLSNFFAKSKFLRIIGFPVRVFYVIFIQWFMGIDINDTTRFGIGFQVFHGQGLIIHSNTTIGNNVTVRHNTTIGVARDGGKCPVIGNNVNIGANSVIIGDIEIGNNVIVAAGSVVVKSIPNNMLVAGNPAKIIKDLL
jgi:putative colanic acid biosynthesis acetyltransferase WcaB